MSCYIDGIGGRIMPLTINHLNYSYMPGSPFEVRALKDVNLTIDDGEFIGIIGHTG